MGKIVHLLLSSYLFMVLFTTTVTSLAVMSVDLGSEWMKIGIVSPGVPMEIALNKESKRKTPAVITFRDGVRTFGEDAQTLGIRFPKNSYSYLLDLLGKEFDSPSVELFRKRFPYYEIERDPSRNTVLFVVDEKTKYSPEELVSQLLHKAKEYAEQSAGQVIKECVLTVPGYFNQAERHAMLQAAQLADLKVLQLINDYTAVGLNYGIFRRKDFNESAYYILFYDMGASSTTATIVSYQMVKSKERGFVETNPQLQIIGVGLDRTLGGLELQLRLRDHLAKKFNEMKLTPNDVTQNARSMAKLFKEAGRVKNVLSANADHYAQIESLLDEKDFRLQITREEFENLCADVFARVGNPVNQALKMAGISLDVLNQVVLVGAGTRVPKVQEELQKLVKIELSKNLNTDEAATMGAVYKAADLSKGFKVKKFITKDGVLYPIQIVFQRTADNGEIKQVKRTLFGLMNPYPQKKIITFNKHTDDFEFNVNYADLDHLAPIDLLNLGNLNISEISLKGVAAAIKKNQGENTEFKGIKAHFQMDDSGILNLVNVESVVEKVIQPEDESTFSKLGSTITNLFKSAEEAKENTEKKEENQSEQPEKTPESASKTEEQTNDVPNLNKTNETTQQNTTKNSETDKEKKPQTVLIKEPIAAQTNIIGIKPLSEEEIKTSRNKIEVLNTVDRERLARETALNNLESFVIDAQNKLDQDEYRESGTPEEIEKIRESCSQISDWLYEDGSDADSETYNKKLSEVQELTFRLFSRVYEHKERPEALAALKQMLNGSEHFLASAKNLTAGKSENEVFTEVEINNLEKIITETTEWRNKMVEEQDKLKKSDPILLTVRALSEKMAALDREVKYLVNKLKIWRPKTPPKEKPVVEEPEKADKTKDSPKEEGTEDQENVIEEPQEEDNTPKEPNEEETVSANDEENHNEL
ncbi:hypoxia up-regulated protein 1 [Chrysoperla carnea]|uniref:hypoxia up-regulated protein 1 n=1 Tax=Chrysoperla carnea TaxID=189513 RepID=UPI001D097A2B|nr:hypoxia up-regulated protein 1 [Chrysoperla carnea]